MRADDLGVMTRRLRRRRSDGGFTLLEVIVAFTILAFAMTALSQAFSGGLRGLEAAGTRAAAVQYARSKLDEVGMTVPLEEGEHTGTFADGTPWTVTIGPLPGGGEEDLLTSEVLAYRVQVTVPVDRQRPVTLTTVRLGPIE